MLVAIIPAFLGVLIGKIIGAVLFTDNGFNDVLVKEIIIGFIALVIAFPITKHHSLAVKKERKLRRHDEKYNPKSLENNND